MGPTCCSIPAVLINLLCHLQYMLLKMPAGLASCAINTLPSIFSGQTVENVYFLGLESGGAWGQIQNYNLVVVIWYRSVVLCYWNKVNIENRWTSWESAVQSLSSLLPQFTPPPCPSEGAWVLNALQEIVLEFVGEMGIQIRFPELQPIL